MTKRTYHGSAGRRNLGLHTTPLLEAMCICTSNVHLHKDDVGGVA